MGPKTDIRSSLSVRAMVSARSYGNALARVYLEKHRVGPEPLGINFGFLVWLLGHGKPLAEASS